MRRILPLLAVLMVGCGTTSDSASAKISRICNHPWWKTKPTESQVEAMAQKIVEANSYNSVVIDENGVTVFVDSISTPHIENAVRDKASAVWIAIRHHGLEKRVDRDNAIRLIEKELDYAEAKVGPASKRK